MTKYLIIHSDKKLRLFLNENFTNDGFDILLADNINDGLNIIEAEKNEIDMCIIGGRFKDGTVLDLKRKMNDILDLPTIVLSKDDEIKQIILSLEYGCDDYLTMPFDVLELKSRIRAVLRRAREIPENSFNIENYVIKKDGFTFSIIGSDVLYKGQIINTTSIEFYLLLLFVTNKGKVFSRKELANIIWKNEEKKKLRTVDVHIRRLREKLEKIENCPNVETKWSEGYYMGELI